MVAVLDSHPIRRPGARLANDPDKYIRRIKGRYQARPYDLGERFDLGLFATVEQARRAIREFWLGLREPIPRFTKQTVDGFVVVVFGKRVGDYETRGEAATAARRYCVRRFGAGAAAMLVRRFA